MQHYLDTVRHVMTVGKLQDNRTADSAITTPGVMMRFNIKDCFPAVTTKPLAFKSLVGELCGFLRSSKFAQEFEELGCKVWNQNANDPGTPEKPNQWLSNPYRVMEGHLGPIYGVQWRKWPAYKTLARGFDDKRIEDAVSKGWKIRGEFDERISRGGAVCDERTVLLYKEIDQLGECVRKIMTNPTDRRILFHGWNPAVLDEVALPACHLLYQFHVNVSTNELSLIQFIRSNDMGLGSPFNFAEAAALLALIARLTGRIANDVVVFVGDAHVYESHKPAMLEQMSRDPLPPPTLEIDARVPVCATPEEAIEWLAKVEPSDFKLVGYTNHGPLKNEMKMAV